MIEFFRDPFWGAVVAFLTLLLIFLGIWQLLKQEARKLLVFKTERIPLVRIHSSLRGQLRMAYRGQAVRSVYMVTIKITNSGNVPVTREDYDERITIGITSVSPRTTSKSEIISAEEISEKTEKLNVTIQIIEKSELTIEPFLLNPKETLAIQAIFINGVPRVQMKARIIGGSFVSNEEFEKSLGQKLKAGISDFISNSFHIKIIVGLIVFMVSVLGGAELPSLLERITSK